MRVRDGRTRSCVVCHKAKQRCEGVVWGEVEEEEELLGRVEVKAVKAPVSRLGGRGTGGAKGIGGVGGGAKGVLAGARGVAEGKDRKSTRLNSSHYSRSRMPSSA